MTACELLAWSHFLRKTGSPLFRKMLQWPQGGRSSRSNSSATCRARASGQPDPVSDPALDSDARHAGELAHVVGDDDQSFAARVTADLHVVRTAGRSGPFELRAKLSVMRRRFVCKGQ